MINWSDYKPVNCMPDGHFYSPIVSKKDIEGFEDQIWGELKGTSLPGIDLRVNAQLELCKQFHTYYKDLPHINDQLQYRYHFNNGSFEHTDAIILYSFIRHFEPQHIIEIGSGYSSALMLDVREHFQNDFTLTFIEPYPKLLISLLKDTDKNTCKIIPKKVQDIKLDQFSILKENDILFIDSSHVSKTGSDVNYELFQILPSLNSGVIVHFHDIFYPFEYPIEWVKEGRNWNENYLLRAFLSFNKTFEILFFGDFIHRHFQSYFDQMPLCYKNNGGSIWLRKL